MLNEKSKYFPDFRVETSGENLNWIGGVLKLYDLTVCIYFLVCWGVFCNAFLVPRTHIFPMVFHQTVYYTDGKVYMPSH